MRIKTSQLLISILLTAVLYGSALSDVVYRVKWGDSLSVIAHRYHVSMKAIAKRNGLKKPYRIKVGQKLIIPVKSKKSKTKKKHRYTKKKKKKHHKKNYKKNYSSYLRKVPIYKYYRVRRGDSVYKIAHRFHVSMRSIIKLNRLRKPYILRPGRKLKILVGYKDRLDLGRPLEFKFPLDGRVDTTLRKLGYPGIFIASQDVEKVKASETGLVKFAGKDEKFLKAFGKTVILEHPDGYTTVYSSLSKIFVKPGQLVKRGQPVGETGNTGNWGKMGVYFEISRIYRNRVYQLNPIEVLR